MSAGYSTTDLFTSPAFRALKDFVFTAIEGPVDEAESFETFESDLHEQVMRFEAEIVAARLKRYDVDAKEIEINGELFRWKMESTQEYCGVAGNFEVNRALFVPRAGGGKAVCPLELRAGIVDGAWTPRAARLMARAVACTTPKEAEQFFDELGGMKPSTSSLDRLPKHLSQKWEEKRERFEEELRMREQVPSEAVALTVSLDGVQVPMKDGDRKSKRSQKVKRPQGPAGFKEVGCGTVSSYDAEGNRLETIRYARMPQEKKITLKAQLEAEVRSILSVRPDLEIVTLADGAPDNWEFLEALPEKVGKERDEAKEAVDLFHVLERVKKALDAYHGDLTPESKAAFEECRIWLREKHDGVERVLRALRYRRKACSGKARKTITAQINYIRKRKERMRYKRLLDQNLPVGSGVVEAACKTLAAERMKRSGMSWREQGGQAILTFRSLIQSSRWESGWALLAEQYRCPVIVTEPAA